MPETVMERDGSFLEREIRDLSVVPRWGILRLLQKQSVMEHSWLVTVYAIRIAEMMGWETTVDVGRMARYALVHDLPEIASGDTPGPLRRALGITKEGMDEWAGDKVAERMPWFEHWHKYTDLEKFIVKLADILEGLLFLATERNLGNRNLANIINEHMKMTTEFVALGKKMKLIDEKGEVRLLKVVNDSFRSEAEEITMSIGS